jgi:hypothetical protein
MTSITIITSNQAPKSDFDLLIEHLNQRYEHYPTKIKNIPLSAEEKSEIAYYDAMGRYAAG